MKKTMKCFITRLRYIFQSRNISQYIEDCVLCIHTVVLQPDLHMQRTSSIQSFAATGRSIQCGFHKSFSFFFQPISDGQGIFSYWSFKLCPHTWTPWYAALKMWLRRTDFVGGIFSINRPFFFVCIILFDNHLQLCKNWIWKTVEIIDIIKRHWWEIVILVHNAHMSITKNGSHVVHSDNKFFHYGHCFINFSLTQCLKFSSDILRILYSFIE